jgi:hypothetical protein
MGCGRCGAENRAEARFCDDCSAGLTPRCLACAAELRDGARFCDACGTPTAAGESAFATDTEGSTFEWPSHLVAVGSPDGRISRLEYFDHAEGAAADARSVELLSAAGIDDRADLRES